ncbi:MAG: HNH endonuclease [Pseudolabrys sp.]
MPNIAMTRQAKSAVRMLRKHGAPGELISLFGELVEINAKIEAKATVRELFIDACKRFNFTAPFSMDGKARHFRARLLENSHPEYAADCFDQWNGVSSLGSEQSYRRGCDHGFSEAVKMMENGETLERIKKKERDIHSWRTRPIQVLGSQPGSDEDFTNCLVLPRGSISARVRFKIFTRDKFRCQICGRSQKDDVTLHVDHRVSVADGGSDELDNLQTLCSDCNLGKSSDSID